MTSKNFRLLITSNRNIAMPHFKCGLEYNSETADKVLLTIKKELRSTRHKNLALRLLNGDIYSMDRMHRFGMVENGNCIRCGARETIRHLIIECEYVRRIWENLSTRVNDNNVLTEIWHVLECKEPLYAIEICHKLINKDRPTYDPCRVVNTVIATINRTHKKHRVWESAMATATLED